MRRLPRARQASRGFVRFLCQAKWIMPVLLEVLLQGTQAGTDIGASTGAAPTSLTNLAEELSLAQLGEIQIASVTTAARHTQKISDAPSSVSLVTADEIKTMGYRSLADILTSVPGFYSTYDRTYTHLGVWGFSRPGDYNSRVLVLVDGHRVNDDLFGAFYVGHEFILNPDLIERVEVVRGPASSLYGNNAFFGVVNVITRKPSDFTGVEASVEAGTYETYQYRFTGSGRIPGSEAALLLSGSYYQSGGNPNLYYPEFDTPETSSGIAHNLDGEQAVNLFEKLTYEDLTLSSAYVAREKHIPTASWDTLFGDPRYEGWDKHGYVDLMARHVYDEQGEIMARTYFDDTSYQATYPLYSADAASGSLLNRDRDQGRVTGIEAQGTRNWHGHTLTAGAEFRYHLAQDIENYDLDPLHYYADVDRTSSDGCLYLQDEFAICTNLSLNAGLRQDYFQEIGGALSPRVGLVLHPWEGGSIKALYGQAFRAPNVYELYYPLSDTPPTGDLRPEHIRTYEVALEQYLPMNLRMELSAFYARISDLISLSPDQLEFVNTNGALTRGLDAEIEWQHASGVRAQASYTLEQAEDDATGNRLSLSPEHLGKLALSTPTGIPRWRIGLEGQYVSSALPLAGRTSDPSDSHAWANLTLLGENIMRGMDLSVSLYNALDAHFNNVGGPGTVQDLIPQDGRTVRIKLTCRF